MRRPHVFQRSAPRVGRQAYQETADRAATARSIAAQLGTMIDKADQAGISELGDLLDQARLVAEKVVTG